MKSSFIWPPPQLGERIFEQAYRYLKAHSSDGFYAADYDDRIKQELQAIMGDKLRFWPLVDQLIFCEEVEG